LAAPLGFSVAILSCLPLGVDPLLSFAFKLAPVRTGTHRNPFFNWQSIHAMPGSRRVADTTPSNCQVAVIAPRSASTPSSRSRYSSARPSPTTRVKDPVTLCMSALPGLAAPRVTTEVEARASIGHGKVAPISNHWDHTES